VSTPPAIRRLCVYCGSSNGVGPAYVDAARRLGTTLAERGIGLVYGGAHVGLMGTVADAVIAGGGEVVGVITSRLTGLEIGHEGIGDLRVVDTMHERKFLMADLADAFVALPGGLGTLEELFEVLTWNQLSIHHKGVGLLDVDGFFGPLLAMLDHAVEAGFIRPQHRSMLRVGDDPGTLLDDLARWAAPTVEKWVDGR
jgi:uncharacterized protein (TIGR00730 family)